LIYRLYSGGSTSKYKEKESYLSSHLNRKHINKYSGMITANKLTYETSNTNMNNSQNINYVANNPLQDENI